MGRPQTVFVGDEFIIRGQRATVTEYVTSLKIKIRFNDDGYETYSRSSRIRSGDIRNPLKRTICGIGFTGIGPHVAASENKVYMAWVNMLKRCYSESAQTRAPTYKGCSVAPEWFDFQVFANWYVDTFTEGKAGWEIDKDVLNRNNKHYSPETCVPLPSELNCLLITAGASRGNQCLGVSWHKRDLVFQAYCNLDNHHTHLGYHATEADAFAAYKTFKEANIKRQANKWRSQIDPRAYDALMNYEVLITD